jgi:hypothetical protein
VDRTDLALGKRLRIRDGPDRHGIGAIWPLGKWQGLVSSPIQARASWSQSPSLFHLSSIPPLSLSPSLPLTLSPSLSISLSLSLSLSLKLAGWLEQGPPCTPTEPSSLGENQDLSMVPGRRPWRHDSIRVTASHPSSFAALPAHRGPSRSSRRHSPCNLYPV